MFFNLSNFFGHLQVIDVAESDGEEIGCLCSHASVCLLESVIQVTIA
jgi:hypothetical protein